MRRPRPAAALAALMILAVFAGDASAARSPPTPKIPVPPPLNLPLAGPPRISLPPAPISVPPLPPPDACGAYLLFYIVGKPRTEIPVPVDPTQRRVVCTTCPKTDDSRPDRLTIEYDSATNAVTKLQCG